MLIPKTIKSVSVSVIRMEINSKNIYECVCVCNLGAPNGMDNALVHPPLKHLLEISSEKLQNCSCIRKIIPQKCLKAANAS